MSRSCIGYIFPPFFFLVLYRYYARVKQSKARINFECVFLSVRKYIQIQKSISMRSFKGFPPWRPWIQCTEVRILLLLLLLRPLWLSTEDRREKGRKYIRIHSFSPWCDELLRYCSTSSLLINGMERIIVEKRFILFEKSSKTHILSHCERSEQPWDFCIKDGNKQLKM